MELATLHLLYNAKRLWWAVPFMTACLAPTAGKAITYTVNASWTGPRSGALNAEFDFDGTTTTLLSGQASLDGVPGALTFDSMTYNATSRRVQFSDNDGPTFPY